MSLFGSIQMGGNTLKAMQIGLQVVGNNIANANTPGYIRQEAVFVPAPVHRLGSLILGSGVLVDSIIQKLDKFTQERLVGAHGDRANADIQEEVYRELELVLNGLSGDVDLSTGMTEFFNALHEVQNDPVTLGNRSLAAEAGHALTQMFASVHRAASELQGELNDRVTSIADEINVLTDEIRRLNNQIATTEGGDTSNSDAAGLRVARQAAIDRLSEVVGIRVDEQPSGAVSITVGGEFLIFEGQRREVMLSSSNDSGPAIGLIAFADTDSALNVTSGELNGLYSARDEIVAGFINQLDELAGSLAFEFNKIFSQGQGLVGFQQLTSVETINESNAALDAAGLPFTPVSGKFEIVVNNKTSPDLTQTHIVHIDLDGIDSDTSLASLAAALDSFDGLSASITPGGVLQLASESNDVEFSFAADTSGVLAALGLNTFFTGSSAASLGINSEVRGINNAAKFAASKGGIGHDADIVTRLAAFLDEPLESAGNATIADLYNQIINNVTQGSSIAQSVAEGHRVFENTLDGQQQAISGVSIDEEAIKMITLQRIYQASAKYIQTCSELLDLLVNL
jgi:flagellar hook-associated protein 1 FlgK